MKSRENFQTMQQKQAHSLYNGATPASLKDFLAKTDAQTGLLIPLVLKCSCDFLHISPLLAPDRGPELGIIWKRGTFLYICMHIHISTPHTHEATREPDTTSTVPTDSPGNLIKGKAKKGFHTPKVTHCLRCKPFRNG